MTDYLRPDILIYVILISKVHIVNHLHEILMYFYKCIKHLYCTSTQNCIKCFYCKELMTITDRL